ncbi:MlaD family protein [Baekduia alba]|uniref:MlaD family protein n=1 Tax=Baekduia alba TaxID=2997333 RepID=UPI002340BE18|nr:MlaD family protein [Baekduia alba]
MRTESLTTGRILVVAAFALTCFGLMLYLWNAFGGSVPMKAKGYRVVVALPEADLLAQEADVRISGVSVGRVVRTARAVGDRKDAELEIDARYAPLRSDVRATIRRKSLAGEEYLELTPGGARTAAVPDGGRLASANVAPSVEVDEVLRTFDAPTRRALATWIQTQAQALGTEGASLNDALGSLPGFEQDLTQVLEVLNRQQGAVRAAVANTGVVFDALSERRAALHGAIVNGSRATDALARGSAELADAFRALPTFEAQSRRLLHRAQRFRQDADPVITSLQPGFRAFSQTAAAVPATARELRGLLEQVGPLNGAARRGLPAARRFFDAARPFVAQFAPFLDQLQPVLTYISTRAGTLSTLVANVTAATNATAAGYGSAGAGVHYARVGMALNPGSLAQYPAKQSWSRVNPYPDGSSAVFGRARALGVFDDRSCARALAFPRLASTDRAGGFSTEMLGRIEHFVLHDDRAAAPPCALQRLPQGTASFPQIRPLSHPGGTTP